MTPEQRARVDADIEALVGTPKKDMALGGAFEGADRFNRQIGAWAPALRSADADIMPDKSMLDARARDMGRNDAYVQWGAQQHRDSIVGSFYFLNSKPDYKALGRTAEWAEEFQQEVESKFTIWAESPQNWVDASRTNSFTQLIRLAIGVFVYSGEALATAEWMPARGRDYRTAVQMIDTDRLSTPPEHMNDPRVRGGIRHDRYGAPITAYIRVQHPNEYRQQFPRSGNWWKEVDFRKPWGRQMVIHLKDQQRVDQTRAVSDLSAGLREIAMTRKFRDVTLQNAVLNASYAATVESELPTEVVFAQLGQGMDLGDAINSYAATYMGQVAQWASKSNNLHLDGAKVPHLFPGTRFQLRPAGTPGGVGQEFESSMLRYIAASLGISYEELSRDYTKTNYSSARAAMLATWRFMQARKRIVADSFANAIFRLWLEEAINNDRLDTFRAAESGMLYTDGYQNTMFDALAVAEWIGAARGQIDELKETQAAVLRIKYGLSTHEYELGRLGKDWRRVFAQKEREQKEMEARGIVLLEDGKMMNAAQGTPREDRNGGEANDDAADAE